MLSANVIALKFTQFKIVFVEFLIPDGIVFLLGMRFHTFHYGTNLWKSFVDYV